MSPVKRKKRRDEIKVSIGPFRNLADYDTCMEIQREVWACQDIEVVPSFLLLAIQHRGGLSLGAYNSLGDMIGFCSSVLATSGGELTHYSHLLGVRRAYRNFDVGFKLKLAQRKEVLKRKIRTITWTFDPMQPLNAYFNLGKLGVRVGQCCENYYGETTSLLDKGLPTDRLFAEWELASKQVQARIESGPPRRDLRKELKKYPVVNTLQDLSPGITTCSPIKLVFDSDKVLLEVPYNLPEIKNRNLGVASEWQGRMRQVFRAYFRKGYAATDFWLGEDEGHLRTFYFLEKK